MANVMACPSCAIPWHSWAILYRAQTNWRPLWERDTFLFGDLSLPCTWPRGLLALPVPRTGGSPQGICSLLRCMVYRCCGVSSFCGRLIWPWWLLTRCTSVQWEALRIRVWFLHFGHTDSADLVPNPHLEGLPIGHNQEASKGGLATVHAPLGTSNQLSAVDFRWRRYP